MILSNTHVDSSKILSLDALAARLAKMREGKVRTCVAAGDIAVDVNECDDGLRVVQCHGVFDLLHIGHIRHLREARSLGDLLVVTITPDRFVNKGPTRPAFNEKLRAEALAALDCVDFVAVNDQPMAEEAIGKLCPDVYVKGGEYRQPQDDPTGGIEREARAVREAGGRIHFTDDIVFSSSSLINEHLSNLPDEAREYLQGFRQRFGFSDVVRYLDDARPLRVAVIGEAIIDEYEYCEALGKSSKEPMLTVKKLSRERFAGGILAVANHLADFSDHVTCVSVVGDEDAQASFVDTNLDTRAARSLIVRPGSPTIVKRRFIDHYYFQKLFSVYEMDDAPLEAEVEERFEAAVRKAAARADMVVVIDFGHGLFTPRVIETLCQSSRFLAVNVQANAGNLGYNTVSKYARADLLCAAEHEMRLEVRQRGGSLDSVLEEVRKRVDCPQLIATRGAHGAQCLSDEQGVVTVPALATGAKDRMGAGDTFFGFAAMAAAQGAPLEMTALIGSAAAAQAVDTVGHRESVRYDSLYKHLQCLLK